MQPTPLQLALNELSTRQLIAAREALVRVGGNDTKRSRAWCEYGFADDLVFDDFLRMYERHGVGHGAVHLLLDKCWQTMPQVIQGEPDKEATELKPWEKKLIRQFKALKMWRALKEADRMRLVGRYSGILLQVKDNKTWDTELTTGVLQKLIPAWEGQLKPSQWDEDVKSERYGEPTLWTYSEASVKENQTDAPGRSITVHHSRVVLLGDYRTGTPFLKAGWNALVTMEKIVGGTGESFLKNASRQLAINFDPMSDMGSIAASYGVPLAELHTAFDDIAKGMNRGQDSVLGLQGAQVSTLVATVPDPEKPFNTALMEFAASVQMPAKVIVGSQTGERASSGDIEAFNQRGQGRREGELADDLDNLMRHLMKYRLVEPVPGDDFSICWDDLTEASASEKAARAKVLSDVNTAALGTGDRVFSVDEIRAAAGFEPAGPELEPLPDTTPVDPTVDEDAADAAPAYFA